MGSCRDSERFAKKEKLLEEMGSCRDGERFSKIEKLLEEMGSCRDGERLPKKRNCWRKWVHAEMEKDLQKANCWRKWVHAEIEKDLRKRNCWRKWVHAWIYFFGFHVLIYKSSNRAIFVQPRKKEHKTNQFFLKIRLWYVKSKQVSKQASWRE